MKLIESTKADAVVSDIAMPEMDGTTLLLLIAKSHPDLPVILVSGHVSKESLMQAISNGVHAVIEKPFRPNALIGVCLDAVRKHQVSRLLNHSINLLMYQFPELDEFLKTQGKEDVREVINREMRSILAQRRQMRMIKNRAA